MTTIPGTDTDTDTDTVDPATGTAVVLLPGLWLTGGTWDAVAAELVRLGLRPVVPALPGVDDGDRTASLDDQLTTAVAALDAAPGEGRAVVVGHSAAASLAWLVADRRPDAVRAVVVIGGFPAADGEVYAELAPIADGVMPFPGWEPFEGPDSADLDEAARESFVRAAVPVPEGVARGVVRLTDDARHSIPATLVCPEFSPDEARGWVADGELPELAAATTLRYTDIDSGHWPLITRPVELAGLIADAAREG